MNKYYDIKLPEGTLHQMDLERDACGVGFVAHIQGQKSNRILKYGITSCCNVVHRGAVNSDMKTGDGAGILTQIPHKLFRRVLKADFNYELKTDADLGVGVFFLPREDDEAKTICKLTTKIILQDMGLKFIGWRRVPINERELGQKARDSRPSICHLFVERPEGMSADEFERTLYLVRRRVGVHLAQEGVTGFYIPSLSHRTIVYKALAVATALGKFYLDLSDPDYETAICLYHQRFSTNTFPTWALAHPFRMLCHNGEINTLRGNRNWLTSRENDFKSDIWGDRVKYLQPMVDPCDSDSATLDIALELLVMSGRSPEEAMALLVPPAYGIDPFTTPEQKAYYEYTQCFSEPWDGPAALSFTDGRTVAACLDRNGLRPSRYKLTSDGIFTLGSEVGVVELDDAKILRKGRLAPGEMLSVNTETGVIRYNDELKSWLAGRQPYGEWLQQNRVELKNLVAPAPQAPSGDLDILSLSQRQSAFGYNKEELDMAFVPMLKDGQEAIYSMGDDTPLAVLSTQPRLLYTYFKQLFAQVTNPPIDPIRERLVMSLSVSLGWQRNLLKESPEHASIIHLETPFLWNHELAKLREIEGFPARTLDTTWPVTEGEAGLEKAVERLRYEAEAAVNDGVRILILSDRTADHANVPVPALIATGAVHHHLNRIKKRMRLSLIVESGEARDVHQMSCLFGYGAQAICPWVAYETIRELIESQHKDLAAVDILKAQKNYRSSLEKGVLKIMSKMGISVLSSYQGAQIFEAVGIGSELIKKCFPGTSSQVEGVGFREIAMESLVRHRAAFSDALPGQPVDLGDPGYFRFRREGERHAVDAGFIKNFHTFVKTGKPEDYESYLTEYKRNKPLALHDLFELVQGNDGPVPIDEVEPIEDIRVRFTTAAMSLGALSPEAHEALAIAMNEIGGKSNSGEGGEDPVRFKRYDNGDWANSKIKQIASGRFGVTAEYLASAEELEIKMAQGAKPGEGGQLPGAKVQGIIARLRRTNPGVQLISPPPHHDIYSIEDLAQLIHDLKEVNPRARICVKLVAESGIGTVAAGVAKANADIILVSGHEGGTGASPISSIKHAGLPWEIGLAETQQVLMMNGLRDRVTLRTDGGLRNGLDIIHAAVLGAEEFNFGTIALIALGCVYVRKCHLNTCPVGIATQDPKYRDKFKGKKEYVINFFNSVAEEVRQHMAWLGVRKLNDLIGRVEHLRQREVPGHPKANTLKLDRILRNVARDLGEDVPRINLRGRNEGSLTTPPLDNKIIQQAKDAINDQVNVHLKHRCRNTDRNIGTKLAGEIAYHHGDLGLPEGTITVDLEGSAGQSFGTFLCSGIKLVLTGEANDYVGKGMTAGEIIIKPRPVIKYAPEENSILGNTVMYGATGGVLFANGRAGERFCVRNSGGTAVVEGVGDHGCEYMTNGTVAILGPTGKNFAAGMSGGVAYVLDEEEHFSKLHNSDMTEAVRLTDKEDVKKLQSLIYRHLEATGSPKAKSLLDNWSKYEPMFWRVQPTSTAVPAAAPAAPTEAVKV
ncbi:MAG TPA: glutamate synthase large subunit [Verrucomicrobiales bacterium]|nr:glutamate synthase large subunit [Verrucomicrobiales bacterium]